MNDLTDTQISRRINKIAREIQADKRCGLDYVYHIDRETLLQVDEAGDDTLTTHGLTAYASVTWEDQAEHLREGLQLLREGLL